MPTTIWTTKEPADAWVMKLVQSPEFARAMRTEREMMDARRVRAPDHEPRRLQGGCLLYAIGPRRSGLDDPFNR